MLSFAGLSMSGGSAGRLAGIRSGSAEFKIPASGAFRVFDANGTPRQLLSIDEASGVLELGRVGKATVILGDLDVRGTQTIIHSQEVLLHDNIQVVSSGPSGIQDGGLFVERYYSEWGSADESGTAQAGSTTNTIKLAAGASVLDDHYNGWSVAITDHTGTGQQRSITDYDGTSKVATVDRAWDTIPDATSDYSLFETPERYAGMIWDESLDEIGFGISNNDPGTSSVAFESYSPLHAGQVFAELGVRMKERTDPTAVADNGFLYTKDFSGDTELCYRDAAGNVVQITEDGAVKTSTSIAGTTNLSWEVNMDSTGQNEDPYLVLTGGDGSNEMHATLRNRCESSGVVELWSDVGGTQVSTEFHVGKYTPTASALDAYLTMNASTDAGVAKHASFTYQGQEDLLTIAGAGAVTVSPNLNANAGLGVAGGHLTLANNYDILPMTAGGSDLGSATAEWGSIYSSGTVYLGSGQEGTLTYTGALVELASVSKPLHLTGGTTVEINAAGGDLTLSTAGSISLEPTGDLYAVVPGIISLTAAGVTESNVSIAANSAANATMVIGAHNVGPGEGRIQLWADDQVEIKDAVGTILLDAGVLGLTGIAGMSIAGTLTSITMTGINLGANAAQIGDVFTDGFVRFAESSDPSAVADKGFVYAKDVSGATELFWRDAAGNVLQITAAGSLNVSTSADGTNNISWTVNKDAVLGTAETPELVLKGGSGLALFATSLKLDPANGRNVLTMTSAGAQLDPSLQVGVPGGTTDADSTLTLNSGDGTHAWSGYVKQSDISSTFGFLEIHQEDAVMITTDSDGLAMGFVFGTLTGSPTHFLQLVGGSSADQWDKSDTIYIRQSPSATGIHAGILDLATTDTTDVHMHASAAGAKTLSIVGANAGAGAAYVDIQSKTRTRLLLDSGVALQFGGGIGVETQGMAGNITWATTGNTYLQAGDVKGTYNSLARVSGYQVEIMSGSNTDSNAISIHADAGAIAMSSVASSLWQVTNADLTLKTITGGSLILDAFVCISVGNYLEPDVDQAIDLGTATRTFRDLYVGSGIVFSNNSIATTTASANDVVYLSGGNTWAAASWSAYGGGAYGVCTDATNHAVKREGVAPVKSEAGSGGWSAGAVLYLCATAGRVDDTVPTGSNDICQVGIALGANTGDGATSSMLILPADPVPGA